MSIKQKTPLNIFLFLLSAVLMLSFIPQQADARGGRGGGGRGGGGRMHTSVHSNHVDIDRHTNVNRGRRGNVNVHRDVDIDVDHRHGRYYHPVATGVAIGATAAITSAVVGSMIYSLPPTGCSTVIRNGISYSQCGSVWYEPRYSGNSVTYVVVNPM